MKLYYSPGASSQAPHIVALELGLNVEPVRVDLATKKTKDGSFLDVNPNGYVPALEMESGEVLTEVSAILQYLADQVPGKNLIPAAGTMERYRVQEWLNFISSEIHKNFGPLFGSRFPDATKEIYKANLKRRYEYLDRRLNERDYLMGNQFTVADAYLFVVTSWAGYLKIDLSMFRNVMAYMERMKIRPSVREAMRAEGLGGNV